MLHLFGRLDASNQSSINQQRRHDVKVVRNLRLVGVAAVALLACSQQSFAAAAVTESGRTRTVSTGDLDLDRPAGVATLYQRIQAAARAVCRDEALDFRRDTQRFAPVSWRKSCVAQATDGAVADAGNVRLSALHRGTPERTVRL
jgi:UrcA family protein